jgi:hypothetical protein
MKYLAILTISLLIYSCANVGTLGGGPIDDKPPVLLKCNITKDNFKGKLITLEFDEYINLENSEKNILIIPKTSTYKVNTLDKKVIIKLDSFLENNITYNLIINGGIIDNNAGNKFYYNNIFSSSTLIDSSKIQINLPSLENNKDLKICLNLNNGIDSFKNFNTEYMIGAQNEKIVYRGIKDSLMNLWLYTDKNNDNKPDFFEPINFIRSIKKDSTYDLTLVNWKKPFKIKRANYDLNFKYLKIYYDKEENISEIISQIKIDSNDIIFISSEYSVIKNNYKTYNFIIDTTTKFNYEVELKNYIFTSIQVMKIKNNYNVQYKVPYEYNENQKNHHLNVVRRTLSNIPDTFVVSDKKLGIQDTFDLKKKSIREEQKLSHLNILINDTINKSYDIKIIKNGKNLDSYYGVNSIDEYFEPDVYKIEIYNHNYEMKFNPFKMDKSMLPIYEKVLYLKASWDEKLVVKIN